MSDAERWKIILAEQFGVGVDSEHRVLLSLDCGPVPVQEKFRVSIRLSPSKARELAQLLNRVARKAEAEGTQH